MGQWLGRFLRLHQQEQEEGFRLNPEKLPRHVAIIMDGNGRWAVQRGLPRTQGHRAGMESIRRVVKICLEYGIKVLTLYAFSTENWHRPPEEVNFLMHLPQLYLAQELPELQHRNVRLCFLGHMEELPRETRQVLAKATRETANNNALILNIAINYGGRREIVDAVRRVVARVQKGELEPADISEDIVAAEMYTAAIGDPDLLIRTGGEARISNFLLWQVAYTELWFTPVLWPDFGEREFLEALAAYQKRERRFGCIPQQNR